MVASLLPARSAPTGVSCALSSSASALAAARAGSDGGGANRSTIGTNASQRILPPVWRTTLVRYGQRQAKLPDRETRLRARAGFLFAPLRFARPSPRRISSHRVVRRSSRGGSL